MTGITELARERLKEKFDVWFEREYKHLESSKYTDAVPHIKYGFWTAYQAGGAELVEALEKAQQRISELESPTFTFEVTAEPFTCPRCGTTTTHPEGWHYCHKREGE
ncbi:hypothetical protein [Raoultella ornithinolytica]|uniref:hypothetical protein n=1 Tax=Raoultella ornithinolytica TaxID=54291 RepID=UPI00115A3979|nr:hypothetical protein [Raoultella ornithinolytica]